MKRAGAILATAALIALASPTTALADLVLVDQYFLAGPLGDPADEADWIEGEVPLSYDLSFLKKYDDDQGFGGGIQVGSFGVVETSDSEWQLSWDLTGTGYEVRYVLIKDGNVSDLGHLYRLYEATPSQYVIGDDTVMFDDPERNISHASWYGVSTAVPDGGMTLTLLGCALVGLGALRRKLGM